MARKRNDTDETEAVEEVLEERKLQDTAKLIEILLASPIKSKGAIKTPDSVLSIEQLAKSNTDVQTRILLSIVRNAVTGDVKSAEFLLKYAGREPAKKQDITLELPTIIDDIGSKSPRALKAPKVKTVLLEQGCTIDEES